MSLQIPDNPLSATGFHPLPAEYDEALKSAAALLQEQLSADKESEWADAGVQQDVQLHRKDNPDDAYDVPWVRGVTTVENATPDEVLATIQVPDMRKKWDARFESGHAVQRYEPQSYLFYSVMKSPSYFIWARDIVGVQRNLYDFPSKGSITVLQKSVDNEDLLPDAGSYAKSRTRATVELSGWVLEPANEGKDTKVTYVVKVHLNGNIPASVVSMLATETPMCTGRVRDVYYSTGFAPHDVHRDAPLTILGTMSLEDGDGTEATAGERRWTGFYYGQGADEYEIRFDNKRMYPNGVNVEVEGEGKDAVKTEPSGDDRIKVTVSDDAKGKAFNIILTPK